MRPSTNTLVNVDTFFSIETEIAFLRLFFLALTLDLKVRNVRFDEVARSSTRSWRARLPKN